MSDEALTRARLKTASAAAIAGLLFSVLLIAAFWLLRSSIPARSRRSRAHGCTRARARVALGMNLIPLAGVAFLLVRGRAVATSSGRWKIAFLPPYFSAAACCSWACCFLWPRSWADTLIAFEAKPEELIGSATFHFARAAVYVTINVYMVKMACVFMITTSTIALPYRDSHRVG